MSIGRDVYCDTRLILSKLEQRFPDGALGAQQPEQRAIQELLERWTVDGGVFTRAAELIPTDMPLLNDPKFTKDREELSGRSWAKDDLAKKRAEALADMKEMFSLLETTLLADDREWILKTQKPSLADIEGKSSENSCLPSLLFFDTASQIPTMGAHSANGKRAYSCLAIPLARRTQRSFATRHHIGEAVPQGLRLDWPFQEGHFRSSDTSTEANATEGCRCSQANPGRRVRRGRRERRPERSTGSDQG